MSIDRQAAREKIRATVRELARQFPNADYCFARESFGLLGKVRQITGSIMPTGAAMLRIRWT